MKPFPECFYECDTNKMNAILTAWNQIERKTAASEILPCCGSRQWASHMADARPMHDTNALLAVSDAIWSQLNQQDWNEAFASHPRIGESSIPVSATAQSAKWSQQEQSSLTASNVSIQARLKQANAEYEQRFGRIYIVCASGKSAAELLAILEQRLKNDAEQELYEAVEQQRQITQLRLRKWLQL